MTFADRLERGRAGQHDALAGLFDRWRPLLRLQARQALGSDLAARLDPSDVVQEALAEAFASLAQFRGATEGEWVAWLRAIVAHQAVRLRRHHHAGKRSPAPERPLVDLPGRETPAVGDDLARLAAAIEELPEAMRQVVVRRVFHHEPFDSIAADLGKTSGAARVLWTRALQRLREALPDESA